MLKKILLVLTFALSLCAIAYGTPITFTSPKNPIVVSQKDSIFTIILQSNPTTGFSWTVKSLNHRVIRVMCNKYIAPQTKRMGAPGYQAFAFQVKHSAFGVHKHTKIVMQYARPWTKNNRTIQTFTVTLQS